VWDAAGPRTDGISHDEALEVSVTDLIVRSARAKSLLALLFAAITIVGAAIAFAQDGTEGEDLPKGIGPITEVELGELDPDLAAAGETLFETYCAACHKFGERYVGPDMAGVTERRSPEWIMNLILNTDEMIFNDDIAYELLAEYMTPMPNLITDEAQARSLLEYFRSVDAAAESAN